MIQADRRTRDGSFVVTLEITSLATFTALHGYHKEIVDFYKTVPDRLYGIQLC